MDEKQRQRLGVALEAKGLNMRKASLAPRDDTGNPLLGATYVRDLIERGRGTKENLELICVANGLSFEFVWDNRGSPLSVDAPSEPTITISRNSLRSTMEDALRLAGCTPDQARSLASLVLIRIEEK